MMNADEMVLHLSIMVRLLKMINGIHSQESGERIIANNLINRFNNFLESVNPFR